MDKSEKAQLYKEIVESVDEDTLLDHMQSLGFWPEGEPAPEEPPELAKKRAELVYELESLRKKGSVVSDPQKALAQERVRRWKESKKKRALAKVAREAEQKKRAEAYQAFKKNTVVHVGASHSKSLDNTKSNPEKLSGLGLPVLSTASDLSKAMDMPLPKLRWLTFHRAGATLVHYHRYEIPKKTGGMRLISAPKRELALAQRWINNIILSKVAPEPEAHGFVAGRSIVTNAAAHVGRKVVINMDLEDFFPSVRFVRARGIFRGMGFGGHVATLLAMLVTEPPRTLAVLDGTIYHVAVEDRALPQGACTSPALTNILCRVLDRRLAGLARAYGFCYTRYADDLTFSGDATEKVGVLLRRARGIVRDEGFAVNEKKTRVMRQSRRQEVTGLTVNTGVALPRKKKRLIRAMVHRLKSGDPSAQAARGPYLRGYLAFAKMVDPALAARWRALLAETS